ncbi:MAG: hypothetical protein RIM99_04040 [Cyclobacteriaceae bacterium]
MKVLSKNILLAVLSILFLGCSDDELSLSESFFKIYDDSNADLSYNPIDVVEITDGYIILTGTELSNTDFQGARLMKVDEEGNYVSDLILEDYVIPVGDVQLIDSITYFFVMNPTSLEAVLMGVNSQLEITTESTINGINYPLASSITSSNDLLLLSYDPVNLTTEISQITTDGNFVNGTNYTIGAGSDVEQTIIDHYLGAGSHPLPFFCGELSAGNYYFNGFYNFSFSLVFTDFSAAPSGVVQGQSSNAGIRAALPLSGSDFAIAGYQFSDNFQLASVGLNTTGITSSVDLYPGDMAELKSYTPVKIISYSTGTGDYTVFASESKGRQIVLHFYDSSSGEIAGIRQLGYLNPFTFSSLKATADNSISVLGTTFVAGRFERVALTKLSVSEISGFLK